MELKSLPMASLKFILMHLDTAWLHSAWATTSAKNQECWTAVETYKLTQEQVNILLQKY